MSAYPDAEGGMTLGELAQDIGFRVLKTPSICDLHGWRSPGGARGYLHGDALGMKVFVDFIDWTRASDQAAAGRLRAFAVEVGLGPAALQRITGDILTGGRPRV